MENPEQADLQTMLLNKLGGWLDGILAEVGMIAQAAGDILKQLAPYAMPWPALPKLQPALARIRQQKSDPNLPPYQIQPVRFHRLRRLSGSRITD